MTIFRRFYEAKYTCEKYKILDLTIKTSELKVGHAGLSLVRGLTFFRYHTILLQKRLVRDRLSLLSE